MMKSTALLAAFCGLLFGVGGFAALWTIDTALDLRLGWRYDLVVSVVAALMFYLLLFLFLLVYGKRMNKRHRIIEEQLPSPVFYKTNGNFDLGGGSKTNGNIYFCESGLFFVCLDEKPYTITVVPLAMIERCWSDAVHLNIYTKDGKAFVMTIPHARKAFEAMLEHGWIDLE